MIRKSIYILFIGLLILFVTYIGFTLLFNSVAPSETEINEIVASGTRSDVLELVESSDQANSYRVMFFVVAAIEVIVTGILAYQYRNS